VPANRHPRMPARFFAGDQERQLERLVEADPADLLRRRLRDEQVPALERSAEERARVALRGRRSSSPGRDGERSLSRQKRSRQENTRSRRQDKSRRGRLAAYWLLPTSGAEHPSRRSAPDLRSSADASGGCVARHYIGADSTDPTTARPQRRIQTAVIVQTAGFGSPPSEKIPAGTRAK
jgi:hypothetical protein